MAVMRPTDHRDRLRRSIQVRDGWLRRLTFVDLTETEYDIAVQQIVACQQDVYWLTCMLLGADPSVAGYAQASNDALARAGVKNFLVEVKDDHFELRRI